MKKFSIIRPNRFFALDVEENGEHQKLPLYAYMTYQPKKGNYRDFIDAGVKLISLAVYAGDRGINPHSAIRPFRPGFMEAPGVYNFEWLDEDIRLAVAGKSVGEVYLILRVMLEMPIWWENTHPDACCLDASGTPLHLSYSSGEWLDACEDALRALDDHLSDSGLSDYVAAYHLAAGSTEEFILPKLYRGQYCDYSEVSRVHFCREMSEKYGSVERLNEAWGSDFTSFGELTIPTPHERKYFGAGDFRDASSERRLLDHAEFISLEVVEFASELARRTKAINPSKLVGAFYGYVGINDPETGHNATSKILDCEYIDFFASPFFYTNARAVDCDWPFAGPIEAAAHHNKPWFTEADVRTFLSRPLSECMKFADPEMNRAYDGAVWYGPDSEKSSISQLLRAYTKIMTHGSAIWWFDMWGGWYDTDAMRDFHRFARRDYEQRVLGEPTRGTIKSQVAVFSDKKSANGLCAAFTTTMISRQVEALGSLGAPYDVYMMDDFATVDPEQYRMAILLCPAADIDERLLARWKCGGRTLIFIGIPGYFAGNVCKSTGFDARLLPETALCQAELDGRLYPEARLFAPRVELSPKSGEIVLARAEDGRAMLVLRRERDAQVILSLAPDLPIEFIREQLVLAGGKVYNFTGENIYAADDVIAVHACKEGVKRVYFPYCGKAFDAISGERLPGTELYAEMKLERGETRMLRFVDSRDEN